MTVASTTTSKFNVLKDFAIGGGKFVVTASSGDLNINSGKFTVAAATGDTAVSGNLAVTGTLTGGLVQAQSRVYVNTGNGYGSTNTKIRRFTTTVTNTGTGITYADSAANGGTFTINEAGYYACKHEDALSTGAAPIGISQNSNQLTTSLTVITAAHRVACSSTMVAGLIGESSCVIRCAVGDVIRAHDNGTCDGVAATTTFSIEKILATSA